MMFISLLFLPSVYALDLTDAVRPIGNIGQFLNGLLRNTSSKFVVIFILCFVLFNAIFMAALKFVKLFKDQDKQRKIFSVALSFLTTISLYIGAGRNPELFTERILGPMGTFGAFMLGLVMFLMVYYSLKDSDKLPNAPVALIASGMALMIVGALTGNNSITSWGFLLFIIGLIWLFLSLVGGGKKDSNNKDPYRDPNSDPNRNPDGTPRDTKDEEDRKRFEEGIKNPAALRVWVHTPDDENLQGAEIQITVGKRKTKGHSNKDGLYPSKDYLQVPSNYPIKIKVTYDLAKRAKYRSKKKPKSFQLFDKTKFKHSEKEIHFAPGQEFLHDVSFNIGAEYKYGFEPRVINVKFDNDKTELEGVVESQTGI